MTALRRLSPTGPVAIGLCYAMAAILIWTGFILVSRAGTLAALGMTDMLAIRFGTAVLLLIPLAWLKRQQLFNVRILVLGLVGGLGYGCFVYSGFERAPATHAALLLPGLMPITIALAATAFAGERKAAKVWRGILISSSGILILLAETLATSAQYWTGDLYFVLACLCWALYTALLRAWALDPWTATVGVVVVTAMLYLPVYMTLLPTSLADVSWTMLLSQGLYQGVLATIVQMICYVRAVQLLDATRMGALMALVPVLSAGLAVPLFGEQITPGLLLGMTLVLAGSVMGNMPAGMLGRFRGKR
ncbi:DMT family transporter [Marinobacterium aestuariivivens]|uniref:DMT family transporter n=1 Tax=Marinobacterium aestuariivivens TaxID=1698799 RepID=A0ABW1ZZJ9_9GAMM